MIAKRGEEGSSQGKKKGGIVAETPYWVEGEKSVSR